MKARRVDFSNPDTLPDGFALATDERNYTTCDALDGYSVLVRIASNLDVWAETRHLSNGELWCYRPEVSL